jgi:hypothetical protein
MYRDDVCAVCGESLPPDHFYCREHAATVDQRLHEIAGLLDGVREDVARLAGLVGEVAGETWDYLAEAQPDDPAWPPAPQLALRVLPEEIDVDVDPEGAYVRVDVRAPLHQLLGALSAALDDRRLQRLSAACRHVEGANATH